MSLVDVLRAILLTILLSFSIVNWWMYSRLHSVADLKQQRRNAIVMICVAAGGLVFGPIVALVLGYTGTQLVLGMVYGAAWAVVLGIHVAMLRRARFALAGVS